MAGGASLIELRGALARAEDEILGGASPRVSPFVDVRDLGGLLQRAGFALPVTDADAFTLRYDSMLRCATSCARWAPPTRSPRARAKPLRRSVFLRAAEIYAENFSDPTGACARASRSSGSPAGAAREPAKTAKARLGANAAGGCAEGGPRRVMKRRWFAGLN